MLSDFYTVLEQLCMVISYIYGFVSRVGVPAAYCRSHVLCITKCNLCDHLSLMGRH